MLEGSCHCGALTVRFDTTRAAADLPVRRCGCTFCLRHRPRYTCDPAGQVTIAEAHAGAASRYRFGLRLADFLICRTCGVFVAAYEPGDPGAPGRAVLNLNALARAADFTTPATQFTAYDSEDAAARTARRARNWTPATFDVHAAAR